MHGEEVGGHEGERALARLGHAHALYVAVVARQPHGAQRLPRCERADPAVRREEAVKERRAGARESDDHDGPVDAALADRGLSTERVGDAHAVRERADEALARDEAPDGVQTRLALDRFEELAERLPERGLAEIEQPGSRLGGLVERGLLERHVEGPARAEPA
jgi:hypothetical protein